MEFRKREVKRPTPPKQKKGSENEQPKEISFSGKFLVVSLVCDPFELKEINDADALVKINSIDRQYNPENRRRTMIYPLSEKEDVQIISSYWNKWTSENNRRVWYSVRENKIAEKEKVVS
tara:strand:+ start:218 stop:577 length:360 start_codon:yes stop_codon:yes gene_type:complete